MIRFGLCARPATIKATIGWSNGERRGEFMVVVQGSPTAARGVGQPRGCGRGSTNQKWIWMIQETNPMFCSVPNVMVYVIEEIPMFIEGFVQIGEESTEINEIRYTSELRQGYS